MLSRPSSLHNKFFINDFKLLPVFCSENSDNNISEIELLEVPWGEKNQS